MTRKNIPRQPRTQISDFNGQINENRLQANERIGGGQTRNLGEQKIQREQKIQQQSTLRKLLELVTNNLFFHAKKTIK